MTYRVDQDIISDPKEAPKNLINLQSYPSIREKKGAATIP